MFGLGTIINTLAVVVGGLIGLLFKKGISERYEKTLMSACGVATIFIGVTGTLQGMLTVVDGKVETQGTMLLIFSLVIGGLVGEMINIEKELKENAYPGRGIIIGKSADGTKAVTAYFIMGRSENSRNRVFVEEGQGIRTQAFDPSKLVDPSLIIYAPVRVLGNNTMGTNGDQTDTVYEGLEKGLTFEQSLRSRQFEPDEPNCTPRISGLLHIAEGEFHYAMSILKSNNGNPKSNNRYTYTYENPIAGEGRFIHTYMHDGNPLPSFEGEPKWISIPDDMNAFTDALWNSLNEENKVSLFVRYIDIATGEYETKIINKNQ